MENQEEEQSPDEATELLEDTKQPVISECSEAQKNKKIGKPKVYIRMAQSMDDRYFGIDGKSLLVKPTKSHKVMPMIKGTEKHFTYKCDGILYRVSQDEVFQSIGLDLAQKALEGLSGIVLSVGTARSGKSYSLFGKPTPYPLPLNLGIVQQTIENLYTLSNNKCVEFQFEFLLSVVDVLKNNVRDCLCEGKIVDSHLTAERVSLNSASQACLLLAKALGEIPDKCNTIIYVYITRVEIQGATTSESRLTFAELASTIPRLGNVEPPYVLDSYTQLIMNEIMKIGFHNDCIDTNPTAHGTSLRKSSSASASIATPGRPKEMAEDIHIRKDIFLLEQMFMTSFIKHKQQLSFEQLKSFGLVGKMEKPAFRKGKFFEKSKLAFALGDVVSGHCEIRILAHLIPKGEYVFDNLKVLRFAARVSVVPHS